MVLLSKFLALLTASLIFPILVIPAIRMVCGFFPKYKDIYPNTLYPLAINLFLINPILNDRGSIFWIIGQAIYVCLLGFWLGCLKNPTTEEPVGFKKGILATLLLIVISVMLFAVVFMAILLIRSTGE
jgi:hypothetical protein